MQLAIRPPRPRFHPLMRHWGSRQRGFAGLGDGTCQVPQPGVAQVYPPCPSSGYTGVPTALAPAVYVAPNYVPAPACASSPNANTADSAECQALLTAAQLRNMALANDANRAVFLTNCNNDWAANAARFSDLGLAVPPNDCAYREYGQTLPGTTGSSSGYLPGTPQDIIDWRAANPGGGSPGPAAGGAVLTHGVPSFSFRNLTTGNNSVFNVGDRWEVRITGAAPNQPVFVQGGQNGGFATTQEGTTDSSGSFAKNGQIDQSQIGSWQEIWVVGGQNSGGTIYQGTRVGSFNFTVVPGTGTGGGQSTTTQPPILKSVFGTLPGGSVSIGGMDIPWVAIGGGLIVAFLLMRAK